ncbi:S-adenosyl-L-methionine-dependent methyltransferase [Amanita muscaria]
MNFYFEAAKVLDRLDAREGSIKGIIATLPEKNRKRTAAVVIETLKYKGVLREIITTVDLLKQERKIKSLNLALVLVHDLLLTSGGIQAADGPIKQAVLRHKTRLHGELQKLKIKRGATSNTELAQTADEKAAQIPRYVRINTILWTTEEALKWYVSEGYTLTGFPTTSKSFSKDEHISDLLLFPPQTSLHRDPNYLCGKLILQDKASCFPAVILDPPWKEDAVVIDATAAPGNKTSHLSALMHNKGKLYAFERDKKRFATLRQMLEKAGCRNVETMNQDFLTVDPTDPRFSPVTHILLDPSCSGSGIINRLDHLLETGPTESDEDEDEGRLQKLAAFQMTILRHAMTFPNVTKIVYSTCSVHAIENEQVVQVALNSNEAKDGNFILAPQNEVLPTWQRRGSIEQLSDSLNAASLIRCIPGEDFTNGFFVACFMKAKEPKKRDNSVTFSTGNQSSRPRKKRRT